MLLAGLDGGPGYWTDPGHPQLRRADQPHRTRGCRHNQQGGIVVRGGWPSAKRAGSGTSAEQAIDSERVFHGQAVLL